MERAGDVLKYITIYSVDSEVHAKVENIKAVLAQWKYVTRFVKTRLNAQK